MRVRFEGGRAVEIDADTAPDTMRTIIERDPGAARLGEVALVDREGRIGTLDTIFYDTLLDENAASHLALGAGFPFVIDATRTAAASTRARSNRLHDRLGRVAVTASRATASTCRSCAAGPGRL